MRIWSLHPKYLDAKGIVALWRETLLAKHVLEGKTKGYKNHPQLDRFKEMADPLNAINIYLKDVWFEANERGYKFDKSKIDWNTSQIEMKVTDGQLKYEYQHLLKKLKIRDESKYKELKNRAQTEPHPVFSVVTGEIEDWEIL